MEEMIIPRYDIPKYKIYSYAGALLNVFIQWEKNGKTESSKAIAESCSFV